MPRNPIPMPPQVRVTIADLDGVVIDQFVLCYWNDEREDPRITRDEYIACEAFGSPMSETMLVDRLRRASTDPEVPSV